MEKQTNGLSNFRRLSASNDGDIGLRITTVCQGVVLDFAQNGRETEHDV